MADEGIFCNQTSGMLALVTDELAKQEQELCRDYLGMEACLSFAERRSVLESFRNRKAVFQLILSLLPDQPKLRLQIVAEILGVMSVMAGATCEHGSCFAHEEVEDSIEFWRTKIPILDVQNGATAH